MAETGSVLTHGVKHSHLLRLFRNDIAVVVRRVTPSSATLSFPDQGRFSFSFVIPISLKVLLRTVLQLKDVAGRSN